jgi:hypothetical protein
MRQYISSHTLASLHNDVHSISVILLDTPDQLSWHSHQVLHMAVMPPSIKHTADTHLRWIILSPSSQRKLLLNCTDTSGNYTEMSHNYTEFVRQLYRAVTQLHRAYHATTQSFHTTTQSCYKTTRSCRTATQSFLARLHWACTYYCTLSCYTTTQSLSHNYTDLL